MVLYSLKLFHIQPSTTGNIAFHKGSHVIGGTVEQINIHSMYRACDDTIKHKIMQNSTTHGRLSSLGTHERPEYTITEFSSLR